MTEVLEQAERWVAAGKRVALATVISTEGSAPRDPGAMLAVNADGEIAGSVSVGCVEAAVVTEAMAVLEAGRSTRLNFGFEEESEFAVGLTCGGRIEVFVAPVEMVSVSGLRSLLDAIKQGRAVALTTLVQGPASGAKLVITDTDAIGSLGDQTLDRKVSVDARSMLARDSTGVRRYGARGEDAVEVFIQSFSSPPNLYVFGATDFSRATVRMGKLLGYRVTVCDARAAFVTRARFPEADELVVRWPHQFLAEALVDESTALCILTHDPKFDVPLLQAALATNAGYIGAMGSLRTQTARMRELEAAGVSPDQLARVRGPIGLDIGARTPEEVAVAIASEITAVRHQRPALSLSGREGPIHPDPGRPQASTEGATGQS